MKWRSRKLLQRHSCPALTRAPSTLAYGFLVQAALLRAAFAVGQRTARVSVTASSVAGPAAQPCSWCNPHLPRL